MKYIVSFFSFLVLLIGGVLFFQYQTYSAQQEKNIGHYTYSQDIDIVYRGDSLHIRHHFRNLPNQSISINWPEQAASPDCFLEKENSCKRLSKDFSKFLHSDIQNQSISYIIPIDGGLKPRQLLKDIFVTLENGTATHSTVHITTDQSINGTWVTGLPFIGQQSLSLVHYSMFSGSGPVNDLYYQAEPLPIQGNNDKITIYSPNPVQHDMIKQLEEMELLNDEHMAVILGDKPSGLQGSRILFSDKMSIEDLKEEILLTQMHMKYQCNQLPVWAAEVVASFLTDSFLGGKKAREITMTLKNQMTDEQRELWVERLQELEGEKIDASLLDHELGGVFGYSTQYFQSNVSADEVMPLLFFDDRDVYVDHQLTKDIDIVFYEGQVLYSAEPLLRHLGYETSVGKNGFYAKNKMRQFRFPFNYDFYVYNQRRYNTVSQPIQSVSGTYYIEESWLQKLFSVEIHKMKDSISINIVDSKQ